SAPVIGKLRATRSCRCWSRPRRSRRRRRYCWNFKVPTLDRKGTRVTLTSPLSQLDRLDDAELAERLHAGGSRIATELRKVIVGQDAVVEQALIALFGGGNCLVVGVPGLAKTLLIHSLAQALDL